MYRRKPFEVQLRKNQYISHIKKIQEITDFNNQYHKSLKKEREDVDALIKQTHQLHNHSMKLEMKKRQKIDQETSRNKYENIKSVLKKELDRKMLPIPDRQKSYKNFLTTCHSKVEERVQNVKPTLKFKRDQNNKMVKCTGKGKELQKTQEDYLKIYENSIISHEKKRKIKIKLCPSPENIKIQLKFLDYQHIFSLKNDSFFVIILSNDEKSKKSKPHQLDELLSSSIIISLPLKKSTITLAQNIREKDIPRFKIDLSEEELTLTETTWISKPIQDVKNRAIGVVQLQLKKKGFSCLKSSKTSHFTFGKNKSGDIVNQSEVNSPDVQTPSFKMA